MSLKSFRSIIIGLSLFFGSQIVYCMESVRVVSNPDEAQTTFSVSYSGDKSPTIGLDISAISVTDVNLDSKEMHQASVAAGERYTVGELSEDGRPDLPAVTSMFIIPDQAGLSLTVSYSGYDDIENIDLAPVQPSPLESEVDQVIPFTKDETIYSQNTFYPGELAQLGEPFIMRDIRAAQVSIYPLQYNPVSKTLRVYRDLSVQISYNGEVVNPKTQSRPYLSEAFYPIYKSFFANFDEVYSSTEIRRGGYLIICRPAIVDSLRALAAWKHQKGYVVRIVPTTEINRSGIPTASQIFNYIQDAYLNWETPPEYVVLAGDITGSFSVIDYPYNNYDSDQKYAQVDGGDYIPDIFIGRMAINTAFQIRMTTAKAIKYEKYPNMNDPGRYLRGLSVGYILFQTARTMTLWVRQLALTHGFTQVDTVYDDSYNSHLTELMNTAPGLSWYRGEAGSDGWWGPSYGITEMNAMPNNQKLSVLFPVACGMADFRYDCMGEIWTRMGLNPDSLKGGPCFYGTTDHGCHTRWNNPHFVGFFWALFEQNNYHFAPATVAGKMQLYRMHPRYVQNGSIVQQYFNTFNILGDPDTEVRTAIPIMLAVSHPDTISFGINHLEINVLDTAGNAIPDAFVTLIKGADSTEEVFSVARTDETGNATLSFDTATPGDLILTVSGRNLYPYQGHIEISNGATAIGYRSYLIDDDALGYSSGNGDSLANPNELLELYLNIKNFGDSIPAEGVTVQLAALDPQNTTIFQGDEFYGTLAVGEERINSAPFIIKLGPGLLDADKPRFLLRVSDNAEHIWENEFSLPIHAPKLSVSAINFSGPIERLTPGATANLEITITNDGSVEADSAYVSLRSADDMVSINSGPIEYGTIFPDSASYNSDTPFVVDVDSRAFPGRNVEFSLEVSTLSGCRQTLNFQLPVGLVNQDDPVGPDAYGYYFYDNRDTLYAEHPDTNWIEIVPDYGGQGQRLDFGRQNTDDNSVLVMLPFDLRYYGNAYQGIIVSCNGFISPDTFTIDMRGNYWSEFFNAPIPDPGNARAQISPFWDDLGIATSGNYGVYTWSDTVNHKYVIEWNHATSRNTSAVETFEIVIFDPIYYPTITGDALMEFQYKLMHDTDTQENYSSVGIENWEQNIGLQYLFDGTPAPGARSLTLHASSILVTTNTGLAGIRGTVDLVGSDSDIGATVRVSGGPRRVTSDSGAYWLTNIVPGSVTMIAEAPGYLPRYQLDVIALGNQTISGIDFQLQPCPIPSNLTASDSLSGRIELNWSAVDNQFLAGYIVYRSYWESNGYERITLNPVSETHYIDTSIPDTSVYWYYVSAIYTNNQWVSESFESPKVHGRALPVSVADGNLQIPAQFFLSQNYPNPFNPTTSISYGIPQNCHVKLEIFNLLGQKVATLIDSDQSAGYKTVIWDGKGRDGREVSSGIYLYKLTSGKHEFSHKMTLLR